MLLSGLCVNLLGQQQKYLLPLDELIALHKENESTGILEICDLTGDSVLGYIPTKENDNNRIAVYAPVSKQDWVTALLSASNTYQSLKAGYSYLFILKDLSVGGNELESYTGVRGVLYESPVGKDAYVFYKTIDNFSVNKSVGVRSAGNSLAGLVKEAVSASGEIEKKQDVIAKTKETIIKEQREGLSFVSKANFPSGIYQTFEEFKALKPSYSQFYLMVDTATKSVLVNGFTIGDTTLHPVENAFAIAAANELYICSGNKLYPVEARGNTLVLSKYVDEITRKNNATFWRSNVGARLSNDYGNPFDNLNVLQVSNYRGRGVQGEAIKINTDTGKPEL
ncbi:MAG: hypothetical protein QM640_05330 [Niabella sp.]